MLISAQKDEKNNIILENIKKHNYLYKSVFYTLNT